MSEKQNFPKGFLWGSAISAYQTEGNNRNSDWWVWEKSPARIRQLKQKNLNPKDYYSGQACDFYNRYKEDIALAKSLHHNAFRLSVEWARLEPKPGEYDQQAIQHYQDVLKTCQDAGMKTFVTLHHFTLPAWFAERGGFLRNSNVQSFVDFAKKIGTDLAQYTDFWITINEPEIYTSHSYLYGIYPPQHRSVIEAWKVVKNLISAHNRAAPVLRAVSGKPVSMAYHLIDIQGVNAFSSLNRFLSHYFANEYILRRTINACDYIGVNYYNHVHLNWMGRRMNSVSRHAVSDLGWSIHPEGIERVLLSLQRYNKPIYITENGIADAADKLRAKFIQDHLFYLHKAISKGVMVKGYLHWSLLDNFEWHHGFGPRFGLIEVDYATQKRRIRDSALAYSKICQSNSL